MNNLIKLVVMSKDFKIKEIGENQYRIDYENKDYSECYFNAIIKDDTYFIIYEDNDTNETNETNSVERSKAIELKSQLKNIYNTIFGYLFSDEELIRLERLIDFCELIMEDN